MTGKPVGVIDLILNNNKTVIYKLNFFDIYILYGNIISNVNFITQGSTNDYLYFQFIP